MDVDARSDTTRAAGTAARIGAWLAAVVGVLLTLVVLAGTAIIIGDSGTGKFSGDGRGLLITHVWPALLAASVATTAVATLATVRRDATRRSVTIGKAACVATLLFASATGRWGIEGAGLEAIVLLVATTACCVQAIGSLLGFFAAGQRFSQPGVPAS